MTPTLQALINVDNDYGPLEVAYREATGSELVRDPLNSVRYRPAPRLSVSIIVPGWNVASTIEQCLTAIELSSFNDIAPERLEVVVVDDGSTDGTWEVLRGLQLRLNLKAVRQEHAHSAAQTRNTALAIAEGDVVISLDGDVILEPLTIEELVKRHAFAERLLLIGFTNDIDAESDAIALSMLRDGKATLPTFFEDGRMTFWAGGWSMNPIRDSDHMRRMSADRPIGAANGSWWQPSYVIGGTLHSMRRADWLAVGGYDARFVGWGFEDTMAGVRAIALGCKVVPIYSAMGWHVRHPPRNPKKTEESVANWELFRSILEEPFVAGEGGWIERGNARIERRFERPLQSSAAVAFDATLARRANDAILDAPDRLGRYLLALGRYDEAASAFAAVQGSDLVEAMAAVDRGEALREAGRAGEAVEILQHAVSALPAEGRPLVELALALAADGRFDMARERLLTAQQAAPSDATVAFVLSRPISAHLDRAAAHERYGHRALAIRDYEAALIVDPQNEDARGRRAMLLGAR